MSNNLYSEWKHYSGPKRAMKTVFYAIVLAVALVSFRNVEIIPEFLADTPTQLADLFKRMWPLDLKFLVHYVFPAILETLHIATLGTLATLMLTFPLAVLASKNIVPNTGIRYIMKFIFVSSRSVNSLIWALFYVALFGPGSLAGVLAIMSRSIGFVGKLLSEAIEESSAKQIEAVVAVGASPLSVFLKGFWPQVRPSFISVALLRWDINIRETAVLGIVGAGGIGLLLESAIDTFHWPGVAAILLAIFAVVLLAEFLVTNLRKMFI